MTIMNESPVLFNMNIKWMSLFSFVRYVRNCSFLGFFCIHFRLLPGQIIVTLKKNNLCNKVF